MSEWLILILLAAILVGLGSFAIVELVRRLPVIEQWTLRGMRPWACNLCMSFWTSALMIFLMCLAYHSVAARVPPWATLFMIWPAGMAIALYVLMKTDNPPSPPPPM